LRIREVKTWKRIPIRAGSEGHEHGVPFDKLRAGFRLRGGCASLAATSLRMTISVENADLDF